jgi:formamidopyrimidine-DNA glycosylase
MPELPDIAAYITALEPRIVAQPVVRVRLASPFVLRTAQPPITSVEGRVVRELRRIGKRIAIGVEGDLWLVLHLMIAGRLHWRPPHAKLAGRQSLAAFDFPNGSLVLTEADTKHRASLYVLAGEEGLRSVDPGGIDISRAISARFAMHLRSKTAHSRGLLQIHAFSVASATPIRMKSCMRHNYRPSPSRASWRRTSGKGCSRRRAIPSISG